MAALATAHVRTCWLIVRIQQPMYEFWHIVDVIFHRGCIILANVSTEALLATQVMAGAASSVGNQVKITRKSL